MLYQTVMKMLIVKTQLEATNANARLVFKAME